MSTGWSVAAVLPLYNEPRTVERVVQGLKDHVTEVIVVDDGSTDEGPALAREAGARVISHPLRTGVGAAIRTGLQAARASGHSAAVVLASNGKDDPREVPRLLEQLFAGADYVQGSRFLPGGVALNLPLGRRILIKGYGLVFRVLTHVPVTDATNGFRAYRLSILDDPRIRLDQSWLDQYELEYYLQYKVLTLGYAVREVAVSKCYPPERRGYSKIRPIIDWWRMIRPVVFLVLRIRS